MKKAIPWIILAVIIIAAVIFLMKKRVPSPKKIGAAIVDPGFIMNEDGTVIITTPTASTLSPGKRCPCDDDPRIMNMIAGYQDAPSFVKPNIKKMIRDECSCIGGF